MNKRKVTNLKQQLELDEGKKKFAYKDHLGFWTIGIGILIDERKGGGLYEEEIEFIFNNRMKKIEAALRSRIHWFDKLDAVRQGVLLNMAFQMGVDGLLLFKNTLANVQSGNWHEAAKGMLASLWAKQTPERAHRLAEQMIKGEWQ